MIFKENDCFMYIGVYGPWGTRCDNLEVPGDPIIYQGVFIHIPYMYIILCFYYCFYPLREK